MLLLLVNTSVSAQCTFRNTAFKSGEFLTYNLYYNWKFVWVKAGTASMSVVQTTHKGKPAYRGSLVTRGNKRVDDFFVLRDTLLCYTGTDMAPMYFRKGAREGKRYTVDEVFYNYAGGTEAEEGGSTDPSGIDAEASIAKGAHIIYKDTNNSKNDFHQRKVSSIKK